MSAVDDSFHRDLGQFRMVFWVPRVSSAPPLWINAYLYLAAWLDMKEMGTEEAVLILYYVSVHITPDDAAGVPVLSEDVPVSCWGSGSTPGVPTPLLSGCGSPCSAKFYLWTVVRRPGTAKGILRRRVVVVECGPCYWNLRVFDSISVRLKIRGAPKAPESDGLEAAHPATGLQTQMRLQRFKPTAYAAGLCGARQPLGPGWQLFPKGISPSALEKDALYTDKHDT
ncbi:hypothetical protein LX36DRAFT_668458 [Colletotrichum falcatum]|nr:hypothetical protein LX36DRAFT_668458 [Colletotrichum falcatum]